jgi:hypothetical protein
MKGSALSGDAARRTKLPALITCGLMLAVSAMMAVWGAYTLSRVGDFGAAADRFSASHQDVDLAPGYFELAFVAGAVISIVFAVIFLLLGIFDQYHRRSSRLLTWWATGSALPFVYLTYLRYGEPYMYPGDTREMAADSMNRLTPWRFSAWYHLMTVGFGALILACLVAAIVSLVLPALKPHLAIRPWSR